MSNTIDSIGPLGGFTWTSDGAEARTPDSWDLTERERCVAPLVAGGLSYKEIAVELNISVNTVATHVKSILRKAGVNSSRRFAAMWQANQHRS
jgi:DNA-binding CsgD family transcriptional regulator